MSAKEIKDIIIKKLDEVEKEYARLYNEYITNTTYKNILTYERNAMKNVLEELLQEIEAMGGI